jgi:amino acid transporter
MDEKNEIHSSPGSHSGPYYGDDRPSNGLFTRFVDSFKRDPAAHATPKGAVGADGKVFDVENAAAATAESPLARKLKGRHLQMIAIGGSIGMSHSHPAVSGSHELICARAQVRVSSSVPVVP